MVVKIAYKLDFFQNILFKKINRKKMFKKHFLSSKKKVLQKTGDISSSQKTCVPICSSTLI